MKPHHVSIFAVLTLLVGLAGCGPGGGVESSMSRALHMIPAGTREVNFTDWTAIRDNQGVGELSSQSSMEARMEFLRAMGQEQLPFAHYGLNYFIRHADAWSWDSTDLAWEITAIGEGPPFYILKFQDSFDLAPVLAHFTERGFSRREYQGAAIYSHELDPGADWQRSTELAIANTAVLQGEKMLILSGGLEEVQQVLDTYKGKVTALAADGAVQSVVDRLGTVNSFVIIPAVDADRCPGGNVRGLPEPGQQRVSGLEFHTYAAMGLGYRFEQGRSVVMLVLHYAEASNAQADLEARKKLAEEGQSLYWPTPYRGVFTLEQATVVGSDIVLQLHPENDMVARIYDLFLQMDMLFAVCP